MAFLKNFAAHGRNPLFDNDLWGKLGQLLGPISQKGKVASKVALDM